MTHGLARLKTFLDGEGVSYLVIHHRADVRAQETAADTDTPPEEFAKTVFLWVDGDPAMAVVPASRDVALGKLRRALGAAEVRLAHEREIRVLCPDCEIGAAPPFGPLYGMAVYASPALARDERITFNGGDHENALRMAWQDFARLVHPRVVPLAKHD
jgi:Ala-tRNA(Pro) deacylase